MNVVVAKKRRYVESNGGFRYGYITHYFGDTGRVSLPDLLANSYLYTAIYHRWSQSIVFECRRVRKRKGRDRIMCPFCVRISFNRSVGSYIVNVYRLTHLG